MFLPVILVSEFGLAAWFVFAIPNVLGAAAMGWTLARPGSSERIVEEHRTACVTFSAVTLAFHLFFLTWLTAAGIIPLTFSVTAVAIGFVSGMVKRQWARVDLTLAWLVLAVSLTVFAKGLAHPIIGVDHPIEADRAVISLISLAPICIFGFLLCPYLDVTFHRTRQETTPFAGKVAFGVGFGVVFLAMIVLTLLYTGDFAHPLSRTDRFGSFGMKLLTGWVALHIAVQAGFKISAHLRALPASRPSDVLIWIIAATLLALAVFAIQQQKWFDQKNAATAMLSGDEVYRLFMSFYGLIFPAYVWICMVPLRGFASGPSWRACTVTGIAIAIAAPMFWIGFIQEHTLWLIPGVAILLLAKIAAPSKAILSVPTFQ